MISEEKILNHFHPAENSMHLHFGRTDTWLSLWMYESMSLCCSLVVHVAAWVECFLSLSFAYIKFCSDVWCFLLSGELVLYGLLVVGWWRYITQPTRFPRPEFPFASWSTHISSLVLSQLSPRSPLPSQIRNRSHSNRKIGSLRRQISLLNVTFCESQSEVSIIT